MEVAIRILDTICPLSPNLRLYLQRILRKQNYLKREPLLREGNVCRRVWFIERGLVGCFYEKSDRQLCSWFMKENDIITSVSSFFTQRPSSEEILALENTRTWYITFEELERIYEKFPEFNYHGRKFITHYYIAAEERMRGFHRQSQLDKYQFLLEHQPDIVNRVSVRDMASYTGMHPDTLSRLRGTKQKKS